MLDPGVLGVGKGYLLYEVFFSDYSCHSEFISEAIIKHVTDYSSATIDLLLNLSHLASYSQLTSTWLAFCVENRQEDEQSLSTSSYLLLPELILDSSHDAQSPLAIGHQKRSRIPSVVLTYLTSSCSEIFLTSVDRLDLR